MTFNEYVAALNGWLGNRDYPIELVTLWIRQAEERINATLRIQDMIKISTAIIEDLHRITLPADWLKSEFVRINNIGPLVYMDRDHFYKPNPDDKLGYYTMAGKRICIGGAMNTINGTEVEVSYYAMVPKFVDASTWLMDLYPGLLTAATLSSATAYGVEDPRAVMWEAATSQRIAALNEEHLMSKTSGSILVAPLRRGFG